MTQFNSSRKKRRKKRSKRSKHVRVIQRGEPISSYGGAVTHGVGGYVMGEAEGVITPEDEHQEDIQPAAGDYVRLDKLIGGGIARVVQLSPEGDTAIVSLMKDQDPDESGWEKGFKQGDHISVNIEHIRIVTKSSISEGIDKFTLEINRLYRDLNL